ncbi:hypothetical protein LG302_13840 [Halomonas organivorans]
MLKRLFRKTPVRCWIIKQIDERILHLCGQGRLETALKPREAARLLEGGEYRGGVRIGDTGIVLNSRLFAALVPLDGLHLDGSDIAYWRGRAWGISQVPQHCWAWEGRLVAKPNPAGHPPLVSSEDVSGIRGRVDESRQAPGRVEFRAGDALEDPHYDLSFERARRKSSEDA